MKILMFLDWVASLNHTHNLLILMQFYKIQGGMYQESQDLGNKGILHVLGTVASIKTGPHIIKGGENQFQRAHTALCHFQRG